MRKSKPDIGGRRSCVGYEGRDGDGCCADVCDDTWTCGDRKDSPSRGRFVGRRLASELLAVLSREAALLALLEISASRLVPVFVRSSSAFLVEVAGSLMNPSSPFLSGLASRFIVLCARVSRLRLRLLLFLSAALVGSQVLE